MLIHEIIKARRAEAGKTQSEAARAAGLKLSHYRAIERGDVLLRTSTFMRITEGLGWTASDFIGGRLDAQAEIAYREDLAARRAADRAAV